MKKSSMFAGPLGWFPVSPLVIALIGSIALGLLAPPAEARVSADGFSEMAERLLPAVVNISSTQVIKAHRGSGNDLPQLPPGTPFDELFKRFLDKQNRGQNPDSPPKTATSLGSGFIIDPDGYVVTNNHVIADADEIRVILQDNTNLQAKLIGRDKKTDVALLKVDAGHPLPFVRFGDADKTRVGDWVLAIGNPFGLGGTVTAGILSARAREIDDGPYIDFLQTDASINRGNSGGPMFNMAGEVIGINSAIYSPSGGSVGIGFAIPSNAAKPLLEQLRQFGKVRRGWLGVRMQSVTDEIADSLGVTKDGGALVSQTLDGPAKGAGIRAGDVIVKFDGKAVADPKALSRLVAATPIDKKVEIVVMRERQPVTLTATIAELVENEPVVETADADTPDNTGGGVTVLGMKLAAISPGLRDRYNLADDAQGVVVTDVAPQSAAAEKGVAPGDLLVEVGQEEVKAPADVVAKAKAASSSRQKWVMMLVDKKGDRRYVVLKADQG